MGTAGDGWADGEEMDILAEEGRGCWKQKGPRGEESCRGIWEMTLVGAPSTGR